MRSVVAARQKRWSLRSSFHPYEIPELPKRSLTTNGTMPFQELSNPASVSEEMYYLDNVFKMWEERRIPHALHLGKTSFGQSPEDVVVWLDQIICLSSDEEGVCKRKSLRQSRVALLDDQIDLEDGDGDMERIR